MPPPALQSVDEPPPSRPIASCAPSSRKVSIISSQVIPMLALLRPSATRRNTRRRSRESPIAVRGWRRPGAHTKPPLAGPLSSMPYWGTPSFRRVHRPPSCSVTHGAGAASTA